MSTEYLPCPFCGAGPEHLMVDDLHDYSVVCTSCGSSGACADTEEEAISFWSRRQLLPEVFQVARLSLRPGDALAIKADRELSPKTLARIRAELERDLPGVRVVIFHGGLDLSSVITTGEGCGGCSGTGWTTAGGCETCLGSGEREL